MRKYRLKKTSKLSKRQGMTKTTKHNYKTVNGKHVQVKGSTGYGLDNATHKLVKVSMSKFRLSGDAEADNTAFRKHLTKKGQEFYDSLDGRAQKEFRKYTMENYKEGVSESRFESHLMEEEDRFYFNLNIDKKELVEEINKKILNDKTLTNEEKAKKLVSMSTPFSVIESYVIWSYENGYSVR